MMVCFAFCAVNSASVTYLILNIYNSERILCYACSLLHRQITTSTKRCLLSGKRQTLIPHIDDEIVALHNAIIVQKRREFDGRFAG